MLKLLEQIHISQNFNPGKISIVNGRFLPETFQTRCFYVTKDEFDSYDEIADLFSKNPVIDCDVAEIKKTMQNVQDANRRRGIIFKWMTDLQGQVLKDRFNTIPTWSQENCMGTILHTVVFFLENVEDKKS
jgi:hypothetical protein